jgi:hypothetical protein
MNKRPIVIGVLHGAISNAGDFLIFERGKRLLETYLVGKYNFAYLRRNEKIRGHYDALIVLGGPIITPCMHPQANTIGEYIQDKNIPVICLGIGINSRKSEIYGNFFKDTISIDFWKRVSNSSGLFSVRDKATFEALNYYRIAPTLTGCPALFDLDYIEKGIDTIRKERVQNVLVTFPYIPDRLIRRLLRRRDNGLFLTLYLVVLLKLNIGDKEISLVAQHGWNTRAMRTIRFVSKLIGIRTVDMSGKRIDSLPEVTDADIHIGTRLHSHIFFLSRGKPSFLFNVDSRTDGFLKMIGTPSDEFTPSGVKRLVRQFQEMVDGGDYSAFDYVPEKIRELHQVMQDFINRIDRFLEGVKKT